MRQLRVGGFFRAVALASVCHGCRSSEPDPARERPPPVAESSPPLETKDGSSRVEAAGESFLFRSWSFEAASTTLAIVDLGMHGSLTEALGSDGRVAINGGFFDPEGRPVGFASSGGSVLSKYSATMSGGVFFTVDGVAHIAATEEFDPKTRVAFAVQCRPRLVVGGRANVKRDDGQRAPRTALCVREEGRTVEVGVAEPVSGSAATAATAGPSLFALGQFLAEQRHCEDALNLDGGPSTGVAYRTGDAGSAPGVLPPRGPLRHAIVVRSAP